MRKIIRDRILNRGKNKCAHCGATEKLQIDHIIPVIRGGREDEDNMQVLCQTCNLRKGKKLDIDKYFKKGGDEFMWVRRDFPMKAVMSSEFKSIISSKFKELCPEPDPYEVV